MAPAGGPSRRLRPPPRFWAATALALLPRCAAVRRRQPAGSLVQADAGIAPRRALPLLTLAAASRSVAQEGEEYGRRHPAGWLTRPAGDLGHISHLFYDAIDLQYIPGRPAATLTRLLEDLGENDARIFAALKGEQHWPHEWTWSPSLYLLMPAERSELSGIYVLDRLETSYAVWTRCGGGPEAVLYYTRQAEAARLMLLLDQEKDGEYDHVPYLVVLDATPETADASAAAAGSAADAEAPGVEAEVEAGADSAGPGPAADAGVSGEEPDGESADAWEVIRAELGDLSANRKGLASSVIVTIPRTELAWGLHIVDYDRVVMEPGLFWEGLPVYVSEFPSSPGCPWMATSREAKNTWMFSAGGRWHVGRAPAGASFEALVGEGFFSGRDDRSEMVSGPHGGGSTWDLEDLEWSGAVDSL